MARKNGKRDDYTPPVIPTLPLVTYMNAVPPSRFDPQSPIESAPEVKALMSAVKDKRFKEQGVVRVAVSQDTIERLPGRRVVFNMSQWLKYHLRVDNVPYKSVHYRKENGQYVLYVVADSGQASHL